MNTMPSPGQLVTVRQRRFVVTDVKGSELPGDPNTGPGMKEPQHLISLSSVEDDGLGEELQVVWELEPGRRVFERSSLPDPSRGFDDPDQLDAFLHAIRWGAIASADRLSLHAPFRSGAALEDYQLDPVARALQMPRVNLLIADDVGLGKTIEAGLVVQELLLRHRARSVLVICPAGLQIQWREQMRDKFGLEFRIVDSELQRTLRRTRGLHVNPWAHFPRLITSLDFIKRERPLRLFRELLPREGEPAFPRRFDLLIVDEAHNVAPAGRGLYALDSYRTDTIRTLTPHFEHKLFLSATPHNGYPESFTALLELLDDQRFQRGVRPDPRQLATVMVRRLKSEIVDWSGKPKFPRRELVALEVPYTDKDRKAHALLADYARSRREGAEGAERFASELVLKLLKKRLFSSPAAFATTLEQHAKSLDVAKKTKPRHSHKPSVGILERIAQGLDEDTIDDEERDAEEQEAVTESARLFRPLSSKEASMLGELRRYAETAAGRGDAKSRVLVDWLKATLKSGDEWNDERAIVFTEYRTTQKWLLDVFSQNGLMNSGRVMTLYGGMEPEDREAIKAAFQASANLSEVRILLATDAASEGIDLQNHCHRLVHYEIPWNPNRMEQRNGRIDRYRQHQIVEIHHFVGAGWQKHSGGPGDLEGDLEFLYRAAVKVNNIREDLGKVGPVIEQQVQEAMLGKRHSLDTERTERTASEARSVLKVERKIREELAKLRERLKESEAALDISPSHVQHVIEVALALAGQPPLEETTVEGIWPDPQRSRCPVFRLPALSGSWALCADGLRHPHTEEIRPIVFDESLSHDRDDVVLVHLHHRLAQMCLGLLRAELWAPDGRQRALRRVAARVVPDKMLEGPAVIAYARLLMLGADNTRLHEELMITGGHIREGRFSRMKAAEAEAALEASVAKPVSKAVLARLAELWPRHRDSILQSIDVRADERKASLMKALEQRAEREAADVASILTELGRSIDAEFKNDPEQLALFTTPEREQFQRNREALARRAATIPDEIKREQNAIRDRYVNPTARLFPAAVVYLIPESLARANKGQV